jgi:hypothetical protein
MTGVKRVAAVVGNKRREEFWTEREREKEEREKEKKSKGDKDSN